MKKIIVFLLALCLLASCEEFKSWEDYNEEWIVAQRDKLGFSSEVDTFEIWPSGILVEKYHTGYGAIPKPSVDPVTGVSSAIKVKYTGWLVDGTCFDHSEESTFYLSGVISGWQEVLAKMPQGSHWKIYLPQEKAYGAEGSPGLYNNFSVPPYSTLIFDIELIDVRN